LEGDFCVCESCLSGLGPGAGNWLAQRPCWDGRLFAPVQMSFVRDGRHIIIVLFILFFLMLLWVIGLIKLGGRGGMGDIRPGVERSCTGTVVRRRIIGLTDWLYDLTFFFLFFLFSFFFF